MVKSAFELSQSLSCFFFLLNLEATRCSDTPSLDGILVDRARENSEVTVVTRTAFEATNRT